MEEQGRKDGRDEMNLAVLPIALLGRNDTREVAVEIFIVCGEPRSYDLFRK
jgi:hypothetical protein